ncbi:MAG: GGDEF domain-containing protein [Nitrospina sp.]|nr:GGDEF domain-containing protein [Nitrospina sp.]MBT7934600.1 GGDEF domain-containing protein [Nitrospina sp.]
MATEPSITSENRFQWTIARKIGGLAMVLIVFILALLLYSIVSLSEMQAELKEIAELDVPLMELINKIEIHQLEQQITIDQLLRQSERAELTQNQEVAIKQRLHAHSEALNQHIKEGIQLSELGFQAEFRSLFEDIHTSLQGVQQEEGYLHSVWIGIIEKIDSGVYPDKQVVDDALSEEIKFDKTILTLIRKIEAFTEREIDTLEKHNKIFFMVNSALGISGVLIGTILSLIIIVGIRSNLFQLTQRVSEVTQAVAGTGSISTGSVNIDSSDEIGKLASELSLMFNSVSEDFQKRDELLRQLKQVATTDKLTGAFNRLKWEENQALEVERVKRSQDELSLIFFDIDFFKKVNDTFGHDVGDLVLIEVVQKTKGNIRQTDSLYRTGGEEFIILTPNTDQEQAGILANKVRQAIEKHDFETVGRVTVSLGCAQFDKKEDSAEQMLKRADQALYRAKEGGRNQVIIAD